MDPITNSVIPSAARDLSLSPADAVLTVDLDAIVGNWRHIGQTLAPGCRAAAVVKADGYGLGAIPIAHALRQAGCHRFFVATLDEAIQLRAAIADADILVLNGLVASAASAYHQHRLIPVLASLDQTAEWQGFAASLSQTLPAALQIDSGMCRLGVTLADARHLAASPDFARHVTLRLIVSHLACADTPDHPMNQQQLRDFATAAALFPGIERSLAASSGIFLGPDFHADWVRPGAALYGLNPTAQPTNPMRPVVRLQAKILQIRHIDAPETVGYGATYRATDARRLATVALGYADGVFRSLSNRGYGHIGDKLVPIVGRVSMDLTVFDVTSLALEETRPGRWIDIIGPYCSVDDVAIAAGTIGYEILTSLGPRIQRRYSAEQPA